MTEEQTNNAPVLIVMGSGSDHEIMRQARDMLKEFDVSCDYRVASAHRAPDVVADLAKNARDRGVKVIIAGAGGAASMGAAQRSG